MTETTVTEGKQWDEESALRPRRLLAALGVWAGLAVVAILNATVRELLYAPVVGDYWGHVASTATFIAAVAVVAALYFRRYVAHTRRELIAIGVGWLLLTVAFEFGFGHYVMGATWAELLADYDLLAGRVWVLVLVALLVAPLAVDHYLRADR
jgi:hypothetical protein